MDVPTPAEPIHVSLAVDAGFAVPLAVTLLSVAEVHHLHGVPCRASVLSVGIDAATRRTIEGDLAGRLPVDWIDIDADLLAGAYVNPIWTEAVLYRLLLPRLLPQSRQRTIYLDADTLVRRPLTDLWQVDLGDNVLGAVRDSTGYAAGPDGTDWRLAGIEPGADYFNSGVLVLPLDRWREEKLADIAIDKARRMKLFMDDQDAIHLAIEGRWLELSRRWNVQTRDAEKRSLAWALWRPDVEEAVADPGIIHYTEHPKPWTGRLDHPFADLWLETLARSSWAAWKDPSRTTMGRVRSRLTRAGNALKGT